MAIDQAHYHGWHGRLHAPWWSSLAIVRVALLQVLRRKSYWFVLALALAQFLLYWSVIYAITQFKLRPDRQSELLENFGFAANSASLENSGYIMFMERQSVVVMILLAFSGSLIVGADFRMKALPFYLSRRIDRRHYIAGKLLAVSAIIALVTVAPALVLFLEYGMFTSSTEYWISNWRAVVAVLEYGAVLCLVLSIWLVSLSAYLQKMAPIAITWSSLFLLLDRLSVYLQTATGEGRWTLINPWRNLRQVGQLMFAGFATAEEKQLALEALVILVIVTSAVLAALVYRVRAVEIVE